MPHLNKGYTNLKVFIYLLKRSHRRTQLEFLFDVMKGFFFPLKVYGVVFLFVFLFVCFLFLVIIQSAGFGC